MTEDLIPYPAGVLDIHGPTARAIASRLSMDLRSDGIDAHPVAIDQVSNAEWTERLPGAKGVVVVYDGRTWIEEPAYGALFAIHPERRVVFVRSRTSRFAPDFAQFPVVPLFDATEFSHYQPNGLSGYKLVVEEFGVPKPAKGVARRGFAFLSYAGADKLQVSERLVPALALNEIGIFDYRFTARLNEAKLDREIQRHLRRSALLVLYATDKWPNSSYTLLERKLACEMKRPIVAVLPAVGAAHLDFPATRCCFGADPKDDAVLLRTAIEEALGKQLPAPQH